jgi:hypothetical protein
MHQPVLRTRRLILRSCDSSDAALVVRRPLEERFLRRALPGYTPYAARVRFRLVPGIW